MTAWTALGVLLMGAALGALLTSIAYQARLRELKKCLKREVETDTISIRMK
jgi:uncharacterized integral membrane protein